LGVQTVAAQEAKESAHLVPTF